MRPTPYVASLRVYEPLEAFEPADQLRWSAISMNELTGREEQIRALQRIIAPESPALRPHRADPSNQEEEAWGVDLARRILLSLCGGFFQEESCTLDRKSVV